MNYEQQTGNGMDISLGWFYNEVFSAVYQKTLNSIFDAHGQEGAGEVQGRVEGNHLIVSVNFGGYAVAWSEPLDWSKIHQAGALARKEYGNLYPERVDELVRMAINE